MVDGIFDSHAHYDDEAFDPDRDAVLRSLAEHGVRRVMNVGCDMESSRTGIALGKQYDFLYSSVGVHPHSGQEIDDGSLAELAQLSQAEKVCAIGEIGLDYHYDFCPREIQLTAFERQLQLARELDLPVIIHSREAANDTLELLKKYRPKGIVHCFSGSLETAKEVYENRSKRVPTAKLNEVMLPIIENYPPPAWKGKYIKIKYITQLPAGSVPSFVFFCNLPQWIKDPYKRFLENKIRENWDFTGTPINIFIREK